MSAANELKTLFTAHWKYMALATACKLDLFDALVVPKTADEVSQSLHLSQHHVSLLLSALQHERFLNCSNGTYSLNDYSELLTGHHPESLKYACQNWTNEHMAAWNGLDYTIKTGQSYFEELYGTAFFNYLNQHPEKLQAYHKAMYEYARDDYQNLPELIDFSKHRSVIDIGGGYGAAIALIQQKHPKVECKLFDLPQVVEQARLQTIRCIEGDFFDKIQDTSDAVLLSRILHDWRDEEAILILKNCMEVLPAGGTLYLIENCSDLVKTDLSLLSLNMSVMCDSYERSSYEYIALCNRASLNFREMIPLNALQTILIFDK